jgi:uncharacterized sporulation protein YeaH/YhbH (DUF444 family)
LSLTQKRRKHVGQGTGDEEEGDVLSKDEEEKAKGDKAGDQAGEDFYEAEIDID